MCCWWLPCGPGNCARIMIELTVWAGRQCSASESSDDTDTSWLFERNQWVCWRIQMLSCSVDWRCWSWNSTPKWCASNQFKVWSVLEPCPCSALPSVDTPHSQADNSLVGYSIPFARVWHTFLCRLRLAHFARVTRLLRRVCGPTFSNVSLRLSFSMMYVFFTTVFRFFTTAYLPLFFFNWGSRIKGNRLRYLHCRFLQCTSFV